QGVRPGDRVGLFLDKSLEAVVGVYGVLKAGAAYVPFDDQAPVGRLAYIARDAAIRCLVSTSSKAGDWATLRDEGVPLEAVVIAGDEAKTPPGVRGIPWQGLDGYPSSAPSGPDGEDDLA